MKIRSLFSLCVAFFAILAPGCSPSSSSADEIAETVLKQQVENQSQGKIHVGEFKKLDGENMNIFGVEGRRVRFEATLGFVTAGWWISGAGHSGRLNFEFTPGTKPINTAFVSSPVRVLPGDQITISGMLQGKKTDNGWQFNVVSSEINPGQLRQSAQ